MKRRRRWRESLSSEGQRQTAKPSKELPRTPAKQGMTAAIERRSVGESLDQDTRRKMERLLSEDLDDVRIHKDSSAGRAAEHLGAKAYTRGSDIYFAEGQYNPRARDGLELLAHELTHVAQTGGRRRGGSDQFEPSGSSLEREASAAAAQIRDGQKPEIHGGATSADVLREEEAEEAVPTVTVHSFEITPAHGRGNITVGGASIAFRYEVTEGAAEATLVLQVPEGIEASFAPLGDMLAGGFRIDDPGGPGARTVKITVQSETGGVPKLRATFGEEAVSHVVIFQFPG